MKSTRMSAIKRASIVAISLGLIGFAGGVLAHGPGHNASRYTYLKKAGVPAKYKGMVNPLPLNKVNLAAGQKVYVENCAVCHGSNGGRPGEAARDLKPPPAKLAGMYGRMKMVGMGKQGPGAHLMHGQLHHHPGLTHAEAMGGLNLDAYNFWAVSEGGERIGSAMPAFKDVLPEERRWQVLLYIANGFRVEVEK